jgi:VIT1/CCC1 family predicted Fe2+/Mn2+ transporter
MISHSDIQQTDSITENDLSVWRQAHYDIAEITIRAVLNILTCIITSFTAVLIGLAAILVTMSVWTFITSVILYVHKVWL